MGFKLKHVFKGPSKVVREIGRSGLFGQRGENFRVLGVKVGKDLVPVVQAAAVVATVAFAGPALAGATGMTTTAAAITTGAVGNAVVASASGGNESAFTKALVVGGASGAVGAVAGTMATTGQQVAVHVAGNTAVSVASGADLTTGLLSSTAGVAGIVAPGNLPVSAVAGATVGAVLNNNPLRGALQGAGTAVVAHGITQIASQNSQPETKSSEHKIESVESKSVEHKIELTENKPVEQLKEKPTEPIKSKVVEQSVDKSDVDIRGMLRAQKQHDIMLPENSTRSSISLKPGNVGVTLGGSDSNIGTNVNLKTMGITSKHSDTTSTTVGVGVSDIYQNGFMIEKKTAVKTPDYSGAKQNMSVSSHLHETSTVAEGRCYSTRTTVGQSLDAMSLVPSTTTTTTEQLHVNNTCIRDAGVGALVVGATLLAPEVMVPVLGVQQLAQ